MDYKRDCKQRQNGGLQSATRVGYNITKWITKCHQVD